MYIYIGEHITFTFTRTYKQHRFETTSIPIYTHRHNNYTINIIYTFEERFAYYIQSI